MTGLSVTGVMSGSSLDGLDLACCDFWLDTDQDIPVRWAFRHTVALPLSTPWRQRLRDLDKASAMEVASVHADFGQYLGWVIGEWHRELAIRADLVSVHGHTLFHEPGRSAGFSTQIGDGAWIAAGCGLPVVTDFRNADIAAGGQGAPMAPLADTLLFPEYHGWLNLGGIANLSLRLPDGGIGAWDVCGANQLLNALAGEAGLDMDRDGQMAARGTVNEELLQRAKAHPWYATSPPRSLSNQWVQGELIPIFRLFPASVEDRLRTAVHFVATRVADALSNDARVLKRQLMVSGGGVFHPVLMAALRSALAPLSWEVVRPPDEQVIFKEALLIALAGARRWQGRPNFLVGVTGAGVAVCGGALYLPPPKQS